MIKQNVARFCNGISCSKFAHSRQSELFVVFVSYVSWISLFPSYYQFIIYHHITIVHYFHNMTPNMCVSLCGKPA